MRTAALVGALAVALSGLVAAPAAAFARTDFQMPFPCNDQWNGATRDNHPTGSGTSLALDFNKGSGSADYGLPVVASAAGKVRSVSTTYGQVIIDHGDGWETRYLHLSSYAVSAGTPVAQGQLIGAVGGTGPSGPNTYAPHLHYEQRLHGVLQHIYFNGTPQQYVKSYNGPLFTSANCPAVPRGDGTVVRSPGGHIYVTAGGAKYWLSPADYAALGSPAFVSVPQATVDALGSVPADNSFLRNPASGAIYQVAGGAKYHLNATEYAALGRPAAVNVPQSWINTLTDVPMRPTFMRDPASGAIYEIAGGARYHLNPSEYAALGNPVSFNAPIGFINRAGLVPADNTFLRTGTDGAVYQILGGARHHLTPAQYAALGGPSYVNVPTGFVLGRTTLVPQLPTFMRDATSGAIYQVAAGARHHLTPAEYKALGSPAAYNAPAEFIAVTGTVPQGPEILRAVETGAIYQVVGGARIHLLPAEYAALGSPRFVNVPGVFADEVTATIPSGTHVLRASTSPFAIYQVVDGRKTYLDPTAYAALGSPVPLNVPVRWLETIPNA